MAAADANVDKLCIEFFHLQVEKLEAKSSSKLTEAQKKNCKWSGVKKLLEVALGPSYKETIKHCETSIMPKHQDRTTKKISDVDFVNKALPDLALHKTKCKSISEPKAQEELANMKKKIAAALDAAKAEAGKGPKNAAVVDRLTDVKGYTGAHKGRFDAETGKGKGIEGRVDKADTSGYVGAYKGADTYDKTH